MHTPLCVKLNHSLGFHNLEPIDTGARELTCTPLSLAVLGYSVIRGLGGVGVKTYRWEPLNNLYSCTFLLSQVVEAFRK